MEDIVRVFVYFVTNGMEEPDDPLDSFFRHAKPCQRPLKILSGQVFSSMGEKCPGVTLPRPASLRILVNKPLVVRLTKEIIQTYRSCNPTFTYSDIFNPKRYLTNPSTGVLNDGLDNVNSDYVLTVNAVLVNSDSNCRYIVKDLLGRGTFGQVVKCWSTVTNSFVAVKVIKNQPAYYHQALVEVSVLTTLNKKFDPEDRHHIVRMHDNFVFHGHLCIAFEMLGANLYELIKTNQFRGISLNLLKVFAKQILDSLHVLRDASVIHCDLKPENILLTPSIHSAEIKLIDFGSACMENQTIYSYIQSRFYRSPEVVLGHPYTATIDMWSFGCIAAELFLGLPLFPGDSEYDLMKRMIERLGGQPPDHILRIARNSSKYFNHVGNGFVDESQAGKGVQSAYQFLSESEYEAREKKKPASGKRYFNYVRLEDIIFNYPHRKKMTKEELAKENQIRLSFVDFLRGLVHFDPVKRWTPQQAAQHPFVTEEPFTGPYRPFPEAPHMHVFHESMVDVNPASSHWFGTSLFPQVVNMNASSPHSQYHPTKFNHTSSCGSLENFCIRGESFGLANNCGCQGDTHIPVSYCPPDASTFNCQEDGVPGVNCLGESPKNWHRTMRVSHEHASGNGMFRPMSFGVGPSQIPSSFQVHLSPGSHGKQDPTSSASGGIHGTALGRAAAGRPYHKIRGFGILGSVHLSSEEEILSQCQVNHQSYDSGNVDMCLFSSLNCNSQSGNLGTPCWGQEFSSLQPWKQRFGIGSNTGLDVTYDKQARALNSSFSKMDFLTTQGMCYNGVENTFPAPDPRVRDPNYSSDLTFQRNGTDLSPVFRLGESIQSGQTMYPATSYGGGSCKPAHIPLQGSPSHLPNVYRQNGLIERQSGIEGRPTVVHASQLGYMYSHSTKMNLHHGCNRPWQKSPSQIGLQSSLFSEQHLQHAYHSQNNPGEHFPSNITWKHQTYYPTDLHSQSTYPSYSHFPVSSNHGCLMPSQRDSQAFYGQSPDLICTNNRIHDVSGIRNFVPLGTMAPHLVHLGQRNPLGTLPASVHGIQDHQRIG